ncbi:MAG: IS4 family transposase [Anaerolineales bacterium]|nr:IS4 family transposase [Anaerolineales bacterium]
MGDNHRVYRRIIKSLRQIYPQKLSGRQARHMNTLAGMVSGIVRSGKSQLKAMAKKAPDSSKVESRIKRFSRYLQNEDIDAQTYFMPFLEALLVGLAKSGPLVLAIDGSEVGRNCLALVVSVIYQKRALPLVWVVVQGSKGHFPEETHCQLVETVKPLLPEGSDVIFLGDGEFDGNQLQADIDDNGWEYVCRTAKNRLIDDDGDQFTLGGIHLQPGDCLALPDVLVTQDEYGPVLVVAWWRKDAQEPIYLVSNMILAEEACYWYGKRFRIETFFSDQKSRGFYLQKSHIADPERISRLLIAACLAYTWVIYLGVIAKRDQWVAIIHRTDRCDLSLFQLGLDLLEHFLNESLPIPVAFQMPVGSH